MRTLYLLHVTCVCLSVAGFTLRGLWMLTDSALLQHRAAKVLPHMIDTALLASAIGMLWQWRMSPLDQPWLMAKITALLVYIGLGMIALRFGRTKPIRAGAYVLALITVAYMVSVALTRNPWGWL